MSNLYVHVVDWDEYQHYGDRNPKWIKNYVRLLDSDEYVDLTPALRGLLHGIWLAYARKNPVRDDAGEPVAELTGLRPASLSRTLGFRVRSVHLDSLVQACYIELSASRTLARRYQVASPEEKRPKEKNGTMNLSRFGLGGELVDITEAPRPKKNPDNRFRAGDNTATYTGCKWVTGAHGSGGKFVQDVLGIDFPPDDWPYPRPTRQEVSEARARLRAA